MKYYYGMTFYKDNQTSTYLLTKKEFYIFLKKELKLQKVLNKKVSVVGSILKFMFCRSYRQKVNIYHFIKVKVRYIKSKEAKED